MVLAHLWKCCWVKALHYLAFFFPHGKLRIAGPGCITQITSLLLTTAMSGLICISSRWYLLFPYIEMDISRLDICIIVAHSRQILCGIIFSLQSCSEICQVRMIRMHTLYLYLKKWYLRHVSLSDYWPFSQFWNWTNY